MLLFILGISAATDDKVAVVAKIGHTEKLDSIWYNRVTVIEIKNVSI